MQPLDNVEKKKKTCCCLCGEHIEDLLPEGLEFDGSCKVTGNAEAWEGFDEANVVCDKCVVEVEEGAEQLDDN